MNLLCRLGRHRPRGIPRWNDGYYFATCEKCGSDLVRTAFQRWHVPRGYRVVWSDRPPASRPEVALVPGESGAGSGSGLPDARAEAALGAGSAPVPAAAAVPEPDQDREAVAVPPSPSNGLPSEPPAPPAGSATGQEQLPSPAPVPDAGARNGRLPIQEVLAQLHAEDAAKSAEATGPAPKEPPVQRRRSTWDFMNEEPPARDEASHFQPAGGAEARSPGPGPGPAVESGAEAASSPRRPGERWLSIRSAIRNFWSGPAAPNPILVIALALAVAAGTFVLILALRPGGSSPDAAAPSSRAGRAQETVGTAEATDPFAAPGPGTSGAEAETGLPQASDGGAEPAEERGYVVASLLSCRAAPALQAPRVSNLSRGDEVWVLSRDGDWASLLYRDGQCWALARFISPVPPL